MTTEQLLPDSSPLPSWANSIAVFDLETTGVDTRTARIVTACVALLDGTGHVVDQRSWLADPGVEIPAQAQQVHGISTEMARASGRPAAEVTAEICSVLDTYFGSEIPVVAYNAPYDFSILLAETERHQLPLLARVSPVVDPLIIDKAVDRYRKGKRTLEAASTHYGVELSAAHDASADAIAAGRVAQAIARAHPEELNMTAQQLHTRQIEWSKQQAESFTAYMRANRDPNFFSSGAWPVR